MSDILKNERLNLMKDVLFLEQEDLHTYALDFLKDYGYGQDGYDIFNMSGNGIFAKGDIPVMLLAHFDTVHRVKPTEETLFYDTAKNQMVCLDNGIGADCRAGVFNILEIVKLGYKPTIMFSWDEEIGGVGASTMTEIIKSDRESSGSILIQEYMKEINFAVQFDRRGFGEAVYYDLDSPDFEAYISSFGYHTEWGSFTDISVICPEFGFAGVNVAAGYTDEHTKSEILHVTEMMESQRKVINMLIDQINSPSYYKYVESKHSWKNYSYAQGYGSYVGGTENSFTDEANSIARSSAYDFGDEYDIPTKRSKPTNCLICESDISSSNWEEIPVGTGGGVTQNETCLYCREKYYGELAALPDWFKSTKA